MSARLDSKVRVLLTTPHVKTTASPWRHIEAIVKYLPKDEFDLTVCSLSKSLDEAPLRLLQDHHVHYIVRRFRPSGGSIRGKPLLKKLQHLLKTWREGVGLYQQPFDLQHSLDYVSHPFEAVLARLHGVPYLFTLKNLLVNANLLKVKVSLSAKVISISEATTSLLRKLRVSETKIRYIPNGIDTNSITFSWGEKEPIILAVGHIVRLKGYEDALRACANLSQKFPEIQLHIIGEVIDRAYYDELQQLIAQLNISGRVLFLGAQNDVLSRMRRASVLIHCSRAEGFGWVLIEAMAVGLPVVSANFLAATQIVQDGRTGFLVKHGDIKGYVRAVEALLTNSELAYNIAKQARLEVEQKFSARRMVEQISEVYREVSKRR